MTSAYIISCSRQLTMTQKSTQKSYILYQIYLICPILQKTGLNETNLKKKVIYEISIKKYIKDKTK